MSLRMLSPWQHPNGIWYARLWVPVDLKSIVKKDEVRRSLRTKDPAEAKKRFLQAAADIQAEWDQLRSASEFVSPQGDLIPEPRAISQKEAHALAGEFYRQLIADNEENPGSAEVWETKLRALQRLLPRAERTPGAIAPFANENSWAFHPARNAYHALSGEVRAFLDARNDNLEANSFISLCSKVALAKRDAFERLIRHARGNYENDPKASRFPELPAKPVAQVTNGPPIDCDTLLALWKNSPGIADKTYKSWSGKLRMLMKFAGKEDVAALTTLDVERWRDYRLKQKISPNTVSAGDLAGVRAVLAWAKQSTDVPSITVNVAEGVKQKMVKPERHGPKSFKLKEASAILSATLIPVSERFTESGAGARRWVPWLCAYSGARVGEVGQLHSSNIIQEETESGRKIWCMHLTPEDGSIKNGEARTVPIHSHVLEQGFLAYVRKRSGKPLFYEPELARDSKQNHRQSDKVGERLAAWVRDEVGIKRQVQPNHAWRHRFETLGRVLKIRKDIVNCIVGHTEESVADEYGDYLYEALSDAIETLPRYNVV